MAAVSPHTQTLSQSKHAAGSLLRCSCDLVAVLVTDEHRRLVAALPIAKGTHVFAVTGRETTVPTRYSVQVGEGLHVDQDDAQEEFDLVRRYYWRFLDHSCEPTAMIRDREVIAVRDIAEGEGVTFDYNTTEYDMATPFLCHCGSPICVGTVRGAKHLTPAQRARLEKWLPDYLR